MVEGMREIGAGNGFVVLGCGGFYSSYLPPVMKDGPLFSSRCLRYS